MEVILARTAGFCMGVRRAVELAERAGREARPPVFTLGPLIHNRQVVQRLAASGVACCEGPIPAAGTAIIRAHGIPPAEEAALRAQGLDVIDATCPHVRHSQALIREQAAAGRRIVLAGDREHPEVRGLAGQTEAPVIVIATPAEAEALELEADFAFLAQTTFDDELFARLAEILRRRFPGCGFLPTFGAATGARRPVARQVAGGVAAVVVGGGGHSANTRRLAAIGREAGIPTVHVETAAELEPEFFAGRKRVGLTAGASTPDWLTREAQTRLERF